VTDARGVGTLAGVGHAESNIVTLKETTGWIAFMPGKASLPTRA
jgi:hypothetical protein